MRTKVLMIAKDKFTLFYIFLSLIIFFLVFFYDQIIWSGEKFNHYFKFYILSFLILIFSFLHFYFYTTLKKIIFFNFIFFVFGIYFLEFFFYFSNNKKINLNDYDNRSPKKVYSSLLNQNKNLKVSAVIPPSLHVKNQIGETFPLAGISNSLTVYCNEIGQYMIYQSDRFGFNNPDFEWENKSYDLVLLGDSYTHGACINRPYDITSVIRSNLNKSDLENKKNILNLGYSGNGPLIVLATLKEYLNDVEFKNVIYLFTEENDLKNLNFEKQNKLLLNYINNRSFKQDLKKKQKKIDILLDNIIKKSFIEKDYLRVVKLTNLRSILKKYFLTKNTIGEKENYDFELFFKIVEEMYHFTKSKNSEFYFAYIPDRTKYLTKENKIYPRKKIFKFLKNKNIKIIDFEKLLFSLEDPKALIPFEGKFGINGNHFNKLGYRLLGDYVSQELYLLNK
tara:strand:- start:3381 stop:4730 length:1350 start_codon:yes stop_codon:yes gene_type:complete